MKQYGNLGLIGIDVYRVQEAPKWHGWGRCKTYLELQFKPGTTKEVSPFLLKKEWVRKPKHVGTTVIKQYHSDDRMPMLDAFR